MGRLKTLFLRDPIFEKFIKWLELRKFHESVPKKIALFEMQVTFPAYIGYSYFARELLNQGCELIGYFPKNDFGLKSTILFKILRRFPIDNGLNWPFRAFRAFGVSDFLLPTIRHSDKNDINQLFLDFTSLNKNEMLDWKIDRVVIGDLFYDWHLKRRGLSTISISDPQLSVDFKEFIHTFFWWSDYLHNNEIDSIFVSHTVYTQGILVRLGIDLNIKVFLVGADRIYRLSSQDLFSDREFIYYEPSAKSQFGYEIDLERGHRSIRSLRAGNSKISMAHSLVSGYSGSSDLHLVNERDEFGDINVLIAAHCFSDNPHAMGVNLFADFSEWIHFLGAKSQRLGPKFNWYIKEHPAFNDTDKIHFYEILENYPHIKVITSENSNLALFNQGINVVLTTYGTIAFEAAYEGILVINASKNSPHVNYPFSVSPSSIDEYEGVIENIPQLLKDFQIDKDSVAHFFDIHHVRRSSNLYFSKKYPELLNFIGGYENLFAKSAVFDFWLNHYITEEIDSALHEAFINFYGGGEYFLFDIRN
jgi:hypothetical protein